MVECYHIQGLYLLLKWVNIKAHAILKNKIVKLGFFFLQDEWSISHLPDFKYKSYKR